MKLDEHGVYRLIQEIVRQLSRDWRDAMRSLRKNPFNMVASQMALDCERFFISDYFFNLTGLDGEKYMQRMGRKYGFDVRRRATNAELVQRKPETARNGNGNP